MCLPMKTSAVLLLTDILPHRSKLVGKVIKNKIFGKYDPTFVFSQLKKAGVDGIELHLPTFGNVKNRDIEEVKEVLKINKMPIFSVHQSLHLFRKTKIVEITRLFSIADMVGAKIVVLHLNHAGKQIFDKKYIDTIFSLQEKYGIKAGFENHEKKPLSRFNTHTWDEKKFPDLLTKSGLYMTLDTTHLAQAGGNIINFFKKHKDSIVNIHLSDYRPHSFSSVRLFRYKHMPLGKGTLPITEFLKTLLKENYKGLVTMEIYSDLVNLCESAKIINENIDPKSIKQGKALAS